MTFKELAGKLHAHRRPGRRPRPASIRAGSAAPSPRTSSTSKSTRRPARSTILRYTAVQDAGKAIHPSYVEGQMQGGAVQGIGWALNEEYFYDDTGRDDERQLPRLPHADGLDLPMIDTIIVEVPTGHPTACAASARCRSCRRRRRSPTRSTRRSACASSSCRCRRGG